MIDFNLHFFKIGTLNVIPIALIIDPILACVLLLSCAG
jgi:hypothetical protein